MIFLARNHCHEAPFTPFHHQEFSSPFDAKISIAYCLIEIQALVMLKENHKAMRSSTIIQNCYKAFLHVPCGAQSMLTDGNWGLLESLLIGTSVVILVNLECFPSWGKCRAGISRCLIYGQFQVKCQKTTPQIWVTLERVGCTGECTGEQRGAEWVIGIVEMVLSVYAKQPRT